MADPAEKKTESRSRESKGSYEKPRVPWYEQDNACRQGGKDGAYLHTSGCVWKDCCARFNMKFPKQGNVLSVRGVVQANSITATFPRRG